MTRLLTALAIAVVTAGIPAFSQTGSTADSDASDTNAHREHNPTSRVFPITAIQVPGTSAANPFNNFDAAYLDPKLQLLVVSSRSSKAVTIFDALTDKPIGETPAIFAGVGADSPHSGPDGAVIAGHYLWAGDYPSTVRVFDLSKSLSSPPEVAEINTGGSLRADEMDFDPVDNVVVVSNGDQSPPFVTFISSETFTITKQVVFDGTNGTPDATEGGIGSVLYNSRTNKFFISIPQVGTDVTAGAVAVMDPVTAKVTQVFSGLNYCMPSGMA